MDAAASKWNEICKDVNGRLQHLPKFQGCLIGGAVGDALGYPVEFMNLTGIQERYGAEGLTEDDFCPNGEVAPISDDTQMTLFTANALLVGDTRGSLRGVGGPSYDICRMAYQDWLHTQDPSVEPADQSWILTLKELHARRAPGNTCLSAIRSGMGSLYQPINDSKGCGGVMRVAPFGLFWANYRSKRGDHILKHVVSEAAWCAALTHGHPLGFISAGAFAYIICRCVTEIAEDEKWPRATLQQIILDCSDQLVRWFPDFAEYASIQAELLRRAYALSLNSHKDTDNIKQLGEGWVGEEALAIAVYASLRHVGNFSSAILAAANHSGDSDSTAAMTGQILGAAFGLQAIDESWLEKLELRSVIMEIAHDLCVGCQMSEYGHYYDADWMAKYGDSCAGSLSINDQLRDNVRERASLKDIEAAALRMDSPAQASEQKAPIPAISKAQPGEPGEPNRPSEPSKPHPLSAAPEPRTFTFKDFKEVVDDKNAEYYEFDFGERYVKIDRSTQTYYSLNVYGEWFEYPQAWSWFFADDRIYKRIDIDN